MKKLILAAVFIFVLFFFIKNNFSYATNQVSQHCLGITGKFSALNWVGGSVMVGCDGDAGKYCKGQLATIKPGETYKLTKCSCPPYADGCIKFGKKLTLVNNSAGRPRVKVVEKISNKCTLTHKNNVCGTNGNVIDVDFKISCNVPTFTPTNTSTPTLTQTPTPTNTPTPTPTSTPTPTPTPTPISTLTPIPSSCPVPNPVTNIKITCPNCNNAPEGGNQ